jgi:hypothetical protein
MCTTLFAFLQYNLEKLRRKRCAFFVFDGIFKDLPSFWLPPLQLPLLECQLKICPMNRSSATYLPVLASWLSMSACHGGSATGKDIPAPALILYCSRPDPSFPDSASPPLTLLPRLALPSVAATDTAGTQPRRRRRWPDSHRSAPPHPRTQGRLVLPFPHPHPSPTP